MTRSHTARASAVLVLWLLATPVFGNLPRSFPEHYRFRQDMEAQILGPVDALYRLGSRSWSEGSPAQFETRITDEAVYLIFSPGDDASSVSRGTYIIKRTLPGGEFSQVKIFLHDDPYHFFRIYPDGLRTRLEVSVHGKILYDRIVLPVSFADIITGPFRRIVDLTRNRIDWDLLMPDTSNSGHQRVRDLAQTMREILPSLPDADDGAMDDEGNWVFIENLEIRTDGGFNCSGFAKWMIDGFYEPVVGAYLDIESLKERHLELRGNSWSLPAEDRRDPYFGLDWTRNLATEWLRLESPGTDEEGADVDDLGFLEYVEDLGYATEDLGFVAYQLAVTYPGHVFLGSVAQRYGENPVLTQHVHVLVLMPSLDESGRLVVTVMERNFESGLESLQSRYPGDRIHFTRVRIPDVINLPRIN